MDLYRKVRLACADGMSKRAAARHFNISRGTVDEVMAFSVPPGYRRTAPIKRPKLDGVTGIIDGWLDGDLEIHRKQRHTAKRVFERLRDEHGFTGGCTIVKDYMRLPVRVITAAALVSELMAARDERRLRRMQKQMAAVKLLVIDELGFVPLSKTGAELLFDLISQRYERGATMITSNPPFDEWTVAIVTRTNGVPMAHPSAPSA